MSAYLFSARHLGSAATLLTVLAFLGSTFWARLELAAQEAAPPKKAAVSTAPAYKKSVAKKEAQPEGKSLTAGKLVEARALAKLIDREIGRKLQAEKVSASPRSDDAEFLRRVYLDLVGVIPPPEKVQAFLASTDADKRAKLIDELLLDERFGKNLAETWTVLLVPRESNNRALSAKPLQDWLAEAFNQGKPLDRLVHDLLTATGTQSETGAVTYFIGNPTVDKITDNVTRMFLGVQLQCAQCHNHPFTDYKQTEYWGMAAFFMKTRVVGNPQQALKKGVEVTVRELPRAPGKKNGLPESAKIVPAHFLRGDEPKLATAEPARPALAQWLTAADNPYFARAMANRFWYQLFGRGQVAPVDDMHADNAAAHPDLLATLTEQFKLSGFDVKYLVRAICNSEAYQRFSKGADDKTVEPDLYSQRLVRSLTPEQLFNSLTAVLGTPAVAKRPEVKNAALKKGAGSPRDAFLAFFRIEDANPLEYQTGIPQALRLMNAPVVNNLNNVVNETTRDTKTSAEALERLYLRVLSRPPSAAESRRLTEFVAKQTTRPAAYSDVLWALLNSSEFMLNH